MAVLAVAGTVGWAVRDSEAQEQAALRDRIARQVVLDQRVTAAIEEAILSREEARWQEAMNATKRAEALLAGGENSPELQQRVMELKTDLDMVAKLEDARMLAADVKDNRFNYEQSTVAFARAFREYGIDVESLSTEEAAKRLQVRAIRVELAQGLDNWLVARLLRPKQGNRSWTDLGALAHAADPDPWRNRLRVAPTRDRKALLELANSADVPTLAPATLVLLGRFLSIVKAHEEAVTVLRQAQRRYPGDFWINHELAHHLCKVSPPRWDEAIRYYTAAMAVRPQSPLPPCTLGWALSNLGDVDEAIARYREAIRLKPNYVLVLSNLSGELKDKGSLDEAIAAAKEAIRIQPGYAPAHSSLGDALLKLHSLDEAIAEYREAIRLDPGYADAHSNLSAALGEQGLLDEAIAAAKEAIRLDPDLAWAYYNLGVALQKKDIVDEAIAAYREALRLKPDLANAHSNLGTVLQRKNLLDEAIAEYREAIRLEPDYSSARNNLGVALVLRGSLDDAITALNEAIRVRPGHAGTYFNLGIALDRKGSADEAIAAYKESIRLEPDSDIAYFSLGQSLARLGRYSEMDAALGEAIRLRSDAADAPNFLAWQLATCPELKFRDPPRAVELARRAIALSPDDARFPNTLGVAQYRAGDWKAAAAALHQSLELRNGGDSFDWFFLAMAHWQLGRKDEARNWYDQATEWMEKNKPEDEELKRFRKEAAELLGP